ncbi:MAG: hypothetical protein ACFFCD_09205 [Promethearchaeota archaeon]
MTEFMDKLISQILDFSERNPRTVKHVDTSKQLARLIEKFHKTTKTLQNSLQETIKKFVEENTIILETAHQPNFLPYSGLFKKTILLEHIARALEKKGRSVVCLFSIVDTDFADDEWFASNRIPHLSKKGYLKLGIKIAKKNRKRCMYAIHKPSQENWKNIVQNISTHYYECLKELKKELSKQNILDFEQIESSFQQKWYELLNIMEESYQKADKFADMNAIFLSKVINDLMACSTIFYKYSDGLNAFENSFSRLVACNSDYVKLYNHYADQNNIEKIQKEYAPFWFHCTTCDGKVPLKQKGIEFKGTCLSCKEAYVFDFESQEYPNLSEIIQRISPRAIPRHYITFNELGVSFYAGGQAGSLYTSIAEKIADTLHFRFPPIFTWFNKDYYTGILQFNSFLQIHRALKLDSYDQFLPKYSELKTKTSQEVKELQHQIELWEIEKNSLKQDLVESQNEESRSRIISELRAITTSERKLKIQIQQAEHNISLLDNAIQSFRIFPSIIDYLLSIDALSLSEQWLHFLDNIEPPMTKPQLLQTNFSNLLRSKFSWLNNIENNMEKIMSLKI